MQQNQGLFLYPVLFWFLKENTLYLTKKKSCVFYTFECCCSNSYTGQASRHLETRIKEHVTKFLRKRIKNQSKTINIVISNAMKTSSIAEHLFRNPIMKKVIMIYNSYFKLF